MRLNIVQIQPLLWFLLLGSMVAPSGARAQRSSVAEADLKAEFVVRIVRFVEWQADGSGEDFVIGVCNDEEFGEVLARVTEGRTVKSRRISVVNGANKGDLEKAQVVIVPGSSRRRISQNLKTHAPKGVLTIGDSEAFLKAGGMISIVKGRKGKMDVVASMDQLGQSGLKVSSKLLRILSQR